MQTGPRSESSTGVASETIVVLQGYLEDANVNPVQMMTQIIEAQRHYQALHQVIESSADMDQTVSRLAGS